MEDHCIHFLYCILMILCNEQTVPRSERRIHPRPPPGRGDPGRGRSIGRKCQLQVGYHSHERGKHRWGGMKG